MCAFATDACGDRARTSGASRDATSAANGTAAANATGNANNGARGNGTAIAVSGGTSSSGVIVPATYAGKLTANEVSWGVSVVADKRITYQPDVLILPNGANAVRAMAPNGLSWTIDANAPSAGDIKVGRILFATGRVVGRVLAVEKSGGDISVTLGPVAITDIIKDCNITTDVAVDLSQALAYAAPKYPGAVTDVTDDGSAPAPKEDSKEDIVEAVRYRESTRPSPFAPVNHQTSSYASFHRPLIAQQVSPLDGFPLDIGTFKQIAFCCGGLGVKLLHDGDDAKILAYAIIHLDQPSLHFNLYISGGTVRTAEVQLNGAAGLTVHFEASTAMGVTGNINKVFFVPVDLSLPISGFGVPFAVTFRQTMVLTTAFTAQNGTINATGDYTFGGSFSMGLRDGSWGVGGPTSFSPKQKLLDGIEGASLGVNGLTFAYGGKVIVGIGAFGFVTGPYFGYNTTVGTVKGSSMTMAGLPPCRQAILDITMRVGIGYMIPQVVTNAINFILTNLNLKAIPSSAGLEHSETIIKQNDVFPAGCGK
ncbi:MAG: hypothetical protein ABJB66_07775 [Gemmatimonadaceae bacterium]